MEQKKKIYLIKIIKILLRFIPFLAFLILFFPSEFKLFGEIAWKILILIMFISPLRSIFPKVKFLNSLMILRRELGIIVGVFGLAHFIGFYIYNDIELAKFINLDLFKLNNFILWGLLGLFVSIPLLLTSNNYSILKLKKNWKKIQSLSYLMFIFIGLHIFFLKNDFFVLFIIALYIILKIISYFRKN